MLFLYIRKGSVPLKHTVFIDAKTTDPDHNLALEEYIFNHLPRDKEYLYLWRNDNAIIIGRHQNTLAEIDSAFVEEKGIRVVRRLSGGGAVYHDMGNLNFTFIVDAKAGSQVDLRSFCLRVVDALRALGLDAQVDGRNDILANGCKVSGNAQYVKEGRVMHHGTLLFDSDLTVLSKALQPDPEKIKAKGVKSVRSRVANIRSLLKQDMTLDQFRDHLARYLLGGDGMRYELTQQDLAKIEAIRAQRYGTWEWNYGASAQCDLERRTRIEGVGTVRAHIRLDHGRIADVTFTGDFFSTIEPAGLSALLRGRPLTQEALQDVDPAPYISGMTGEALRHLLLEG
jgi:lipoate-protein ligase A